MQRVDEIAKKYKATISRFRGLTVATVPVECNEKVDIGFSRKQRELLARFFPSLKRRELRPGLYAHGNDVDRWVRLFAADDALCSASSVLLQYAYSIEWAEQSLSGRINTYFATVDGDSTGGDRFFGNLATSAGRLSAICKCNSEATSGTETTWGPKARRQFATLAAFVMPFALLVLFHYFTTRLTH
jgi:hypothetical protein